MNKIKKLFTKNITIKVICLAVSAILWIYVASSQNNTAKFPGAIPLKTFNNQSNLVAVYDVKSVEIKVKAESAIWQNLSSDSFSAYIDLSGYSAGTFEVPVTVVSLVPNVQVVEKTPDRIMVSLEPVVTKDVSVVEKIEGDAASGMIAGAVAFSPATVSIRGAQSIIGNINEVTATIKLNGESEDFERTVSIDVANDKYSQKDIQITPPEVLADVSVVKGASVKTVGIKTVLNGNPANGYYISEIKVIPATVDITGLTGKLSGTGSIETLPININNVSADIDKDVQLNIPEGIYLSGNSSEKVRVQVKIASIDIIKEVSISDIKLLNANGLSFVSSSPSEIKIKYTGQPSLLSVIKSTDFSIMLDMAYKTPNGAGEVTFDVTRDIISAPTGITILEILPSSLLIKTKS